MGVFTAGLQLGGVGGERSRGEGTRVPRVGHWQERGFLCGRAQGSWCVPGLR